MNTSNKNLIKFLLREEFKIIGNKVTLVKPYDNIKKIMVNGHPVYSIFGDVDYYGPNNKESILALKKTSNKFSLDKISYQNFLFEFKKRFNSIPELKNANKLVSIETTAPLTKEMANVLGLPFIENGFSKINKQLKLKTIKPEDRYGLENLFVSTFDVDQNDKLCILDDFITTGTSFKNAFNVVPPNIPLVGVCLFVLKV